jgi:bla regulator protein blaR1
MTYALLVELAWKSALCAAAGLLMIALLERRSAAEKALIAHVTVLALVMLPVSILLMPRLPFPSPAGIGDAISRIAPAPTTASAIGSEAPTSHLINWRMGAVALYVFVALLLLGGLGLALIRLRFVRARAELLSDPRWLSAFVAAQQRIGCKTGTALLISSNLDSPVSWGLLRPTIIIDAAAALQTDRAETIIAHELAHVVRLDWLRLVLGRVAVALFWFNPLVWLLARRSHQLAEEAADDAVLRTNVPRADYADLLLHAIRHAQRSPLLAANGVAPSRSSLSRRIGHVLDTSRQRAPVQLGWAAASLLVAAVLDCGLASAIPAAPVEAIQETAFAGEQAAAQLEQLKSVQARRLAAAIRSGRWGQRRVEGDTLFNEPAAVAPLLHALGDDRPEVRAIAIWGLSEMRPTVGQIAAPEVAALLSDPSPQVREQAAGALGDFGAYRYASAIANLLHDRSPDVRLKAAHALGDLQLPSSLGALESAQHDRDPDVRIQVDWAIGQVREAQRIVGRSAD